LRKGGPTAEDDTIPPESAVVDIVYALCGRTLNVGPE